MTFSETMEALDNVRKSSLMSSEFFVEAVAYQQAAIEEMERRAFSVEAMHPMKDKRARLRVAARYIKTGIVKFPRHGCEQLLTQLLGFGAEKHDDGVDALVYLILGLVGEGIALACYRTSRRAKLRNSLRSSSRAAVYFFATSSCPGNFSYPGSLRNRLPPMSNIHFSYS